MNELSKPVVTGEGSAAQTPPLDHLLAELIEVVWACEAAARREDRIDAAIKYGRA